MSTREKILVVVIAFSVVYGYATATAGPVDDNRRIVAALESIAESLRKCPR